jgi:type II secretory pathway component PulL
MKCLPERERNIACIQACRSHLVEEWLKLMVVESVDQQYINIFLVIQTHCGFHSSKTATQYNYPHMLAIDCLVTRFMFNSLSTGNV